MLFLKIIIDKFCCIFLPDILKMVPDFVSNPYISDYTKPFNILLLGLIDKELSHEEIDSAAQSMRMIAKAAVNTESLR